MKMSVCNTCGHKSLDSLVSWEVKEDGSLKRYYHKTFPLHREDAVDLEPIIDNHPNTLGHLVDRFNVRCPECDGLDIEFKDVDISDREFPLVYDFEGFSVDYAKKILVDMYYYNNPEELCLYETIPMIEVRGFNMEDVVRLYALLFERIEGDKTLRFIDECLDEGNKSFEDAMDLTK